MGNEQSQQSDDTQQLNHDATVATTEKLGTTQKLEIKPFVVETKIRIAVIGIGDRLRGLISLLDKMHPELVQIVAFTDCAPEALEIAKQAYKNATDVQFFADYKEMFQNVKQIDWVLIGSKNHQHYEHCIAAFENNANVFCEKPIATKQEHCVLMKEMWQRCGKHFVTGFVLRHAPLYAKAHSLIKNGFVGKVVSIDANEHLSPAHGGYIMRNWRRFKDEAGPHILEKCCHDIDILNMLTGSKPLKVAAFGGLDIFKIENQPKSIEDRGIYCTWSQAWEQIDPFESNKTIEDNLVCILQYQNGVKVSFNINSNSAWAERRMRINGIEGTIELDLCSDSIKWKRTIGKDRQLYEKNYTDGGVHGGGDFHMINELCQIMANGKQPKVSIDEGFISCVSCLAIEEARESGQVVDLHNYWLKLGFDKNESVV